MLTVYDTPPVGDALSTPVYTISHVSKVEATAKL